MMFKRLKTYIFIFFFIYWFGCLIFSQPSMPKNFAQVRFFYSEKMDRYVICAIATDESTKCGKLDWNNTYLIIENNRNRRIKIENDKLEVLCTGNSSGFSKMSTALGRFNIIIDNSGSIDDERLKAVEKELMNFLNKIPPGFEAQVIKFSDDIQVKSGFSSDKQLLIKNLKVSNPRGSCALWDAMEYGVRDLIASSETYPFLFQIVLTTGKDTGSKISIEEFKREVIPKCEENLLLIMVLDLSDNTEPNFTKNNESIIFQSEKISDLYDPKSSSSPITALESHLNFLFRLIRNGLEGLYIFRFTALSQFDDIKAVYLVKEERNGKDRTIKDFYTSPVMVENYNSFWISIGIELYFRKIFEELRAKLPPPKEPRKTFVTNLSFMDVRTQSTMADTELSVLLDEAVLAGMKNAKRRNSRLYINEAAHIISNTDRNVVRLVNITFDPNRTKEEKINRIISDMMSPNGVDVIATGQYIDDASNPLIYIRPLIIIKSNQKIYIKNLQFTRKELLCRHPENGKRMLCKNAFDQIAKAVQELLEQL